MKALYYVADDVMELRDIPVPVPKADEYLVKIDACGICGSDFEGFKGKTGRRVAPMIMGHECAGTVAQAPAGGKYPAGTRVVPFPKLYCGKCDVCLSGKVNLCPHGDFLGVMKCNGAMTEYITLKEQYLIPYTSGSAEIASLAEPAAVAYNGVSKLSDEEIARAGDILVVGTGTIGLLVLTWLKYRGAKHVIVSDATDFRLDLAKRMGADDVINPTREDFAGAVSRLTGGRMCGASVEAVGISPTAASSIDALRLSGIAVWIGNAAKMVSINMQSVVTKDLQIRGNYVYSLDSFKKCVRLLTEGAVDVSALITSRMDLSDGVKAFDLLNNNRDGRQIKIVLTNS